MTIATICRKVRDARNPGPAPQPQLWRRVLELVGRFLSRRQRPGRLRLSENLQLGERRFVAVVEFEQSRFLLGGTPASLVLLARLEGPASVVPATISTVARPEIEAEASR